MDDNIMLTTAITKEELRQGLFSDETG